MAIQFAHNVLPRETQKEIRRRLRTVPTWKLQEAYNTLRAGQDITLVDLPHAYATSAIEEALWERGRRN